MPLWQLGSYLFGDTSQVRGHISCRIDKYISSVKRLTTAVHGAEQDQGILVQVMASGGIFLARCRAGNEGIQAAEFAEGVI